MKFGWWQKNYIYGVEYGGWPKTIENGKKKRKLIKMRQETSYSTKVYNLLHMVPNLDND